MKRNSTFGVHFIVRQLPSDKCYLYARIVVNKSASELAGGACSGRLITWTDEYV